MLGGCNFLYDFSRTQCEEDVDCQSRGESFAATQCVEGYCVEYCEDEEDCPEGFECTDNICVDRWGCVGEEPSQSSAMIRLQASVRDISGGALVDREVRLCSNFDPSCETPAQTLTTDSNGDISFEVEPGYAGYLEVTAPEFFAQMNFLPEDLAQDTVLPDITLSPTQTISGLATVVGADLDEERGHILINVGSCDGDGSGVRFAARRADEVSILYYVNAGIPASDLDATTAASSGGFLNFRPGNATIDLETEGGRQITQLSLIVRKNTISVLRFDPSQTMSSSESEGGQ